MQKSIVFDGPDGCGKSTLIDRLHLERVHTVAFKQDYGDPVRFYLNRVLEAQATGFDRLHLSEWVYGPILREGSAISREQIDIVTRILRGAGVSIVMVFTDWETSVKNVRSRPFPAYQTDDFLWQSYCAFRRLADSEWVDFVYTWHRPEYGGGHELQPSRKIPENLLDLM